MVKQGYVLKSLLCLANLIYIIDVGEFDRCKEEKNRNIKYDLEISVTSCYVSDVIDWIETST